MQCEFAEPIFSHLSSSITGCFAKLNSLHSFSILLFSVLYRLQQMSVFLSFKEERQDDHENMQEMDILDMSVLDDTENDNGIPAEDDEEETVNLPCDDDALLKDDNENKILESEDEAKAPEV